MAVTSIPAWKCLPRRGLEPTAAPHITRLDMTPDVAGQRLRLTVQGTGIAGQTVQVTAAVKSNRPPVVGDVYGCGTDVPSYLVAP